MINAEKMTPKEYQDAVVRLSAYPKSQLERWFSLNDYFTQLYTKQYAEKRSKELEKRLFGQIVQREIYTDAMNRKLWKDMRSVFFGERINELRQQYGIN